jgi:hypothetical protein
VFAPARPADPDVAGSASLVTKLKSIRVVQEEAKCRLTVAAVRLRIKDFVVIGDLQILIEEILSLGIGRVTGKIIIKSIH